MNKSCRSQTGVALAASLIFLLITTIAAVTAVQISTSQELMAANVRFKNDSFQAAEKALRVAEKLLHDDPDPHSSVCSGAGCSIEQIVFDTGISLPPAGWHVIPASAETNGMTLWYRIINLGQTHAPANVISAAPGTLYRVVVVSFRGNTRTILESIYVRSQA